MHFDLNFYLPTSQAAGTPPAIVTKATPANTATKMFFMMRNLEDLLRK